MFGNMLLDQVKNLIKSQLSNLLGSHPELPNLLQDVENSLKGLEPIVAKVNKSDVLAILQEANKVIGSKLTQEDLLNIINVALQIFKLLEDAVSIASTIK